MQLPANFRVLALLLLAPVLSQATEPGQYYPEARRQAIVDEIHGITVADPYRWMEQTGNPELEEWVAKQNALTRDFVGGQQYEESRQRLRELATFDRVLAARRRGEKLFFMRQPRDSRTVELHLRAGQGSRTLLRSDEVPEKQFDEVHIGGKNLSPSLWPDRTGSMLLYAYTDRNSRPRHRILEVETGLHLPEVLDGIGIAATIAWSETGDGFYYSRSRTIAAEGTVEAKREPAGLWFHALGTRQEEDKEIVRQGAGDRHVFTPYLTGDGKRLVVEKREGTAKVNSVLVFDRKPGSGKPLALFTNQRARFLFLGSNGSRLFFQTTQDAPNGRVVAVDLLEPTVIREVVPESEFPMLAGSNVGGDVVGYFGDQFVLGYLRDGLPDIRVFDSTGAPRYSLDLPPGSSIWGLLDNVPGDSNVTVSLLNPFSPGHVATFNVRDGSIRDELRAEVPIDASDFTVERIVYESGDGTRVPMSIVYRKGLAMDGNNPTLVYGYGMHRWVSLLFYQAHILHWLELGGIYAMPAIRGGGEYGDRWHADGTNINRQNAVDDFVAAGRWLIENGYTSPARLAANGGSASGALAGIVSIRYGDVFAASTVDYPIADLVRAPRFGSGALLAEEYGSIADPAQGKALIAQSPYHQLGTRACRIPTLVMVGEDDKVALPFHGYKLTAALQHAQNCPAPMLMYRMPGTGHNYGLSAELYATNTAVQISFLRRVLGF